jgi:hypothetical protein
MRLPLICPILNTTDACNTHKNCLFLRNGGCAVVLSAVLAEKADTKIDELMTHVKSAENEIRSLRAELRRKGIIS